MKHLGVKLQSYIDENGIMKKYIFAKLEISKATLNTHLKDGKFKEKTKKLIVKHFKIK
jgi:predicted XRE-type DNA-binding protein